MKINIRRLAGHLVTMAARRVGWAAEMHRMLGGHCGNSNGVAARARQHHVLRRGGVLDAPSRSCA